MTIEKKPDEALKRKRKTRSAVFLILSAVFIVYIVIYPDYWIFSSIMAAFPEFLYLVVLAIIFGFFMAFGIVSSDRDGGEL